MGFTSTNVLENFTTGTITGTIVNTSIINNPSGSLIMQHANSTKMQTETTGIAVVGTINTTNVNATGGSVTAVNVSASQTGSFTGKIYQNSQKFVTFSKSGSSPLTVRVRLNRIDVQWQPGFWNCSWSRCNNDSSSTAGGYIAHSFRVLTLTYTGVLLQELGTVGVITRTDGVSAPEYYEFVLTLTGTANNATMVVEVGHNFGIFDIF